MANRAVAAIGFGPAPGDRALSAEGSAISLDHASVRIGGQTVWSDVTVEIPAGEFVAVLGPNGAGKSTLLKAVLGLQHLAAGSLQVLGSPAGHANRHIGYLPQRRSFDTSVRVRGVDVVRMGLDGARWGLPLPLPFPASRARRQADRELVGRAIELAGASAFAHRSVSQTSGGEQQRLLIAQALVRQPKLLLLDEPLDSLDLPNQHAIAALVHSICRERGLTVLMVAHDVNPILGYLDRVVYLANGGAHSGTPEEVVRTDVLSRLYDAPVEVLRTSDGRTVVVGTPDTHSHHHHFHVPG